MSGQSLWFCEMSSSVRQTASVCEDAVVTDRTAGFMLITSGSISFISSLNANCFPPPSEDLKVYLSVECRASCGDLGSDSVADW